jgi:hypothetical protein
MKALEWRVGSVLKMIDGMRLLEVKKPKITERKKQREE